MHEILIRMGYKRSYNRSVNSYEKGGIQIFLDHECVTVYEPATMLSAIFCIDFEEGITCCLRAIEETRGKH